MYIIYEFHVEDGSIYSQSFSGNSHQRRKDARMIARSFGPNTKYRVYKWVKGDSSSNGYYTK